MAKMAGRFDVDAWIEEVGIEQLAEWEAYFCIEWESQQSLPFEVQSQDDIAKALMVVTQ